jgi:basic membrane lipoprotein Med (substrate-binding protein (PBP1-ABC) superfamily)
VLKYTINGKEKILVSKKLYTYQQAKEEIERLKRYVYLIETYEVKSLEDWILLQYAYTNSIKKVVEKAAQEGIVLKGKPSLDLKYVSTVINSKPKNELHQMIREGYKEKIKPIKKAALRSRFY